MADVEEADLADSCSAAVAPMRPPVTWRVRMMWTAPSPMCSRGRLRRKVKPGRGGCHWGRWRR
ncbi:hypothetical protein EJB05_09505, partial [Eragrostis curvula]